VASIWRTWGVAAQAIAGSAAVVSAADGRGASPKVSTLLPSSFSCSLWQPLVLRWVAARVFFLREKNEKHENRVSRTGLIFLLPVKNFGLFELPHTARPK
jgi:hypothetical protein